MIRVFTTRTFNRFARKNGIDNRSLCHAIERAMSGLIDVGLGAGLIKQRVARPGKGKSGGFRTIIAFKSERFACFLHGFAKSDQSNIDREDLSRLQDLASELLKLSANKLEQLIADENLIEVTCHDKAIS